MMIAIKDVQVFDYLINLKDFFPLDNSLIIINNKLFYVTHDEIVNAKTGIVFNYKRARNPIIYTYGLYDEPLMFIEKESKILFTSLSGLISGVDSKRFSDKNHFTYFYIVSSLKIKDFIEILTILASNKYSDKDILNFIHSAYNEGYSEQLGTSKFQGDRLKFILSLLQNKK